MVEMEFRQHSLVHERALADIRSHGVLGKLDPMTRGVDYRSSAIMPSEALRAEDYPTPHRVVHTKSARHMADVYELAELAFARAGRPSWT